MTDQHSHTLASPLWWMGGPLLIALILAAAWVRMITCTACVGHRTYREYGPGPWDLTDRDCRFCGGQGVITILKCWRDTPNEDDCPGWGPKGAKERE